MQSVVAMIGQPEIFGLLVILVTMLGAHKIPELLNGMRHGIHEFKQATREVEDEVAKALETEAKAGDGRRFHRYGFKFWLIVVLGVAAMWAVELALRELLP
jgi:sec-independent protein translocase protein TatA